MISVCIVSGRRGQLLGACLDSLVAQIEPPAFEVLVAADRDPAVGGIVNARFPTARVGLVTGSWMGAARNFLIARARGDLVLFLDDDVVVDRAFLRKLADIAAVHPEAGVFGGPNLTPPGSSRFQVLQGAVLGTTLGSGPVRRRYGRFPEGAANERWFTLCGMAFRHDVVRPFAVDLTCAEENALMADLSRAGVAMHYSPDLFVYHERRPDVWSFLAQVRKYGRGRGQLMRKSPRTMRPSYLLPSALVLMLVVSPVLAVAHSGWLAGVAVYAAVATAGGARAAQTVQRPRAAPAAAALVVGMHVAYGLGVFHGLLRRRRPRATNATWVDIAPVDAGVEVGEVRPQV